jgi:hypothetical protein
MAMEVGKTLLAKSDKTRQDFFLFFQKFYQGRVRYVSVLDAALQVRDFDTLLAATAAVTNPRVQATTNCLPFPKLRRQVHVHSSHNTPGEADPPSRRIARPKLGLARYAQPTRHSPARLPLQSLAGDPPSLGFGVASTPATTGSKPP